jgi:hypothetical protein
VKESEIQRQILDYLALKRIFNYRQNSGAFHNGKGGFYRFGALGAPDIVCVIAGQYVRIEVKAPKSGTRRIRRLCTRLAITSFIIRYLGWQAGIRVDILV